MGQPGVGPASTYTPHHIHTFLEGAAAEGIHTLLHSGESHFVAHRVTIIYQQRQYLQNKYIQTYALLLLLIIV